MTRSHPAPTVLHPPSLRDLLQIPAYRTYFITKPNEPNIIRLNPSWQIWARRIDESWATKQCSNYNAAFELIKKLLKQKDTFSDVCLVSRSILYPCPYYISRFWGFEFEWCARCRRPTVYLDIITPRIKSSPLTVDEPFRCYYCGARKIFACLYQPEPIAGKVKR